jgi:hypothetical protein
MCTVTHTQCAPIKERRELFQILVDHLAVTAAACEVKQVSGSGQPQIPLWSIWFTLRERQDSEHQEASATMGILG